MGNAQMIREFGRAARLHWTLPEPGIFLNHGSFGACPRGVQLEQERVRREYSAQPEEFFRRRVMPDNDRSALRKVADELGTFVETSGDNIALVENATAGIQTVLQSVSFAPGDEILITDHQYRAVRLAVEKRCRETGAIPRIATIGIPTSASAVINQIMQAANPKTKLAIIDHITSATALLFPIREIVAGLHARGIPVLVDGAHAIGQVPLALDALGAEWYVSNAHKWLYAPPGCAFLYARADCAERTQCLITSHFTELGFPRAFDYVGTRDYGNWLTLPAAIGFHARLEPVGLKVHAAKILATATDQFKAIGATPVSNSEMCGAVRSFVLPQTHPASPADAGVLRDALWDEERIQIGASVLHEQLLLRVSAPAYVDEDDVTALREALERRGWPGR